MNFVLFRFKSRRLCARNAARSTRRKVATNDTKHSERTSLHVPFSATILDDIVKNVLQNSNAFRPSTRSTTENRTVFTRHNALEQLAANRDYV